MTLHTKYLWIVLLLLTSSALYFTFVERTIQYDEAYTLRHFAVNPIIALFNYSEPNNHMLNSLLVWLMTTLAGRSLFALRFPALAMALLSGALIYHVGSKFGGLRLGLTAAVFLLSNWTFADYAISARGYTLSIFLTLALINLVFLKTPEPIRTYRYSLLVTCVALIITLPTMIFLIAAVLLWLLWAIKRNPLYRITMVPMLFGSVTGTAFYTPAALVGALSRSAGRFGYTDLGVLLSEWFSAIFGAPILGYVLVASGIIGCILLLRRYRQYLQQRILIQLFLTTIIVAVLEVLAQFVMTRHTFYGRNYLYLLPVICLIAAAGLTLIGIQAWKWGIAVIMITATITLPPFLSRETIVDQVLARIDTLLRPNDMIIVEPTIDEAIFYSLQAHGQWERLLLTPDKTHLIVLMELGIDAAGLIDNYQLVLYTRDCHPTNDPRWLPLIVYECSLKYS